MHIVEQLSTTDVQEYPALGTGVLPHLEAVVWLATIGMSPTRQQYMSVLPLDASAAVTVGGIYKITAEHVVEAVPVAQATQGDEGTAARVVAVPVQQPTGGDDIVTIRTAARKETRWMVVCVLHVGSP